MAGRLWVFDLDGTLIATSRAYGYAALEFVRFMLDTFARKAEHWFEIAQLLRKIGNEQTEIYGAARHRFPGSMAICYQQLCNQRGIPEDEAIVLRVLQIGEKAFDREFYRRDQLLPGVEETLNFLWAQGDNLFVLTKGDPDVQWPKWEEYNLDRWFPTSREFRVVPWDPSVGHSGDKGPVLAELREEYPKRKIYMVGDSVPSDMIPAVEAGVIGVHIPAYSKWEWRSETPPLPEGVIPLKKIADIIEEYESTL